MRSPDKTSRPPVPSRFNDFARATLPTRVSSLDVDFSSIWPRCFPSTRIDVSAAIFCLSYSRRVSVVADPPTCVEFHPGSRIRRFSSYKLPHLSNCFLTSCNSSDNRTMFNPEESSFVTFDSSFSTDINIPFSSVSFFTGGTLSSASDLSPALTFVSRYDCVSLPIKFLSFRGSFKSCVSLLINFSSTAL